MRTKRGSAEWRAKISAANLGRGKGQTRPPFSKEWRDNIAKARRGQKLPPRSEEHRRNLSIAMMGKKLSEEAKRKIGKIHKGTHLSEEHRLKLSLASKNHPQVQKQLAKLHASQKGRRFSKEHRDNLSISLRTSPRAQEQRRVLAIAYKVKLPEIRPKLREARRRRRFPTHHTKPEKVFETICQALNLPFRYTGDGAFWIEDINPDFVNTNGYKVAVEIFGDYWHSPLFRQQAVRANYTEEGRRKTLRQYGWKLIVFWESELNLPDAKERVLNKLVRYARR